MILNTGFDGSAVKLAQGEFAWRQSFFKVKALMGWSLFLMIQLIFSFS